MRTYLLNLFIGSSLLLPLIAGAAVCPPTQYCNPITYGGISTIPDLLLALVDLVFLIGVPIVVISIIYSGFLFVTAGDNESKSTKARFVFTWTMIGALVLFGAKAIALAVQTTVLSLGS